MRAMRRAVIGVLLSAGAVQAEPPKQPRLDAHGFPLPDGAIARLGDLRFAQPGPITALAVSPDDKMIATAGDAVYLWDAASGRIVGKLPGILHAQALAFSHDGRFLAVGGVNGACELWNVRSRALRWADKRQIDRFDVSLTSLHFLDNDATLAVAHGDCRVALWDVNKGSLIKTWQLDATKKEQLARLGPNATIQSAALSPSGRMMAWLIGVGDRSSQDENPAWAVMLQDSLSGRLLRRVTGNGRPTKLHLLDEGRTLLLQSQRIFSSEAGNSVVDIVSGNERFEFPYRLAYFVGRPIGGSHFTHVLAASPDGKFLYTRDEVGTMRLDLNTGKTTAQRRDACGGIAFLSGGKQLVVANGPRLQVCDDLPDASKAEANHATAPSLAYAADGQLVSCDWPEGRLCHWDSIAGKLNSSQRRKRIPNVGRTPSDYDSCGTRFAHHDGKEVVVRDLLADRDLCKLRPMGSNKKEVEVWGTWPAFSGDGKRVFLSHSDEDDLLVRWFCSDNGREEGRMRIPWKDMFPNGIRPLRYCSHDGSEFGYYTPDSRFAIVNCENRKVIFTGGIAAALPTDDKRIRFPAWDYKLSTREDLLIASKEKSGGEPRGLDMVVADRATGYSIRHFLFQPAGEGKGILPVTWRMSPDARLVAASLSEVIHTNRLSIYESASGRRRGIIRAPAEIHDFAFAPDGRTLATSCADTTVLIWDIDRPLGKGKPLSFAKDGGDTLWRALGDEDAEAAEQAIWALVREPEKALSLLRQRLRPIFTPKERLRELIARLDSPVYEQRLQAADELKKLGELAVTPLRVALKKGPSLEQSRRLQQLLTHVTDIARPPACLRELRAVEALERIGSPAARQLVTRLAGGTTDSLLTREAAVVMARWGRDDRSR